LVTDNLGCSLNLSTTLTKPPLLEVQLAETDVLCFGDSNGTVTTSPTGGVAPYSFIWTNGATIQNLSGLPRTFMSSYNSGIFLIFFKKVPLSCRILLSIQAL
jgi:hypothetical protein